MFSGLTDEDYLSKVPSSISNVLLRVGGELKLHCPEGASWTKHGVYIENDDKYRIDDHSLVIQNTGLYCLLIMFSISPTVYLILEAY